MNVCFQIHIKLQMPSIRYCYNLGIRRGHREDDFEILNSVLEKGNAKKKGSPENFTSLPRANSVQKNIG